MKNIHVLPTDKASRLYLFEERLILGDLVTVVFKNSGAVNQHIYITSDEEIEENWFLDDNNQISHSYRLSHVKFANPKKIILTTDQDLIKDGVQAIDDEFLEWFVKNPSCERVDIETMIECEKCGKEHCDNLQCRGYKDIPYYKIIIPKEEPKQDLEKEMFELEQELDIPSHLRWHNSKPKQETLEYDLLQQIKFCLECKNDSQAIRLIEKYGFEKQEKCEKDLDAHLDVAEHLWLQVVKENKKMYNKEELLNFADFYHKYKELIKAEKWEIIEMSKEEVFKKWFEQFKNK